ncbi:tyrosine-type recombinase/integrase [Embleya sp. NPDC059237]|uniref:tyrosine-type recombinase/integrase n=1 Tax=Embleya sp. NPDC059237 TaxID=3346784 RepID=UPI0036977943
MQDRVTLRRTVQGSEASGRNRQVAFKGRTFRRCACTGPKLTEDGTPVLDKDNQPVQKQLGAKCPRLKRSDHGRWYWRLTLPNLPNGERNRPGGGGFVTKTLAEQAAQQEWDKHHSDLDTENPETVTEFMLRWIDSRVDLKRSTTIGYRDYIDRFITPTIGHIRMVDLTTRDLQEKVFGTIWRTNDEHAKHKADLQAAQQAQQEAKTKWQQANRYRRPPLRQAWLQAREATRAAKALPRNITGPGSQLRLLNMLSTAMTQAAVEKLTADVLTVGVRIPTYVPAKPMIWTPERVEAWRKTGVKPSRVMVWTPEQAGEFLDAVVGTRMYPVWHLLMFVGLRRAEVCGLPWAEVSLERGTLNISETLVALSYDVWEDTPKSEEGDRTVPVDSVSIELLKHWRLMQDAERERWQAAGAWVESGLMVTRENGSAFHPEYLSKLFKRILERLGLPPIRLQDLRHCAATFAVRAGVHMSVIKAILGHTKNSKVTEKFYAHVYPEHQHEAVEMSLGVVPRRAVEDTEIVPLSGGAIEAA